MQVRAQKELVLLHRALHKKRISRTVEWLNARGWISAHHHVSVCLFACLLVQILFVNACPSSACLFVFVLIFCFFIRLFSFLFACLFVCLPTSLPPARLSTSLSPARLSVYKSVSRPSVCLQVCLPPVCLVRLRCNRFISLT
jgi:hypothetical protein